MIGGHNGDAFNKAIEEKNLKVVSEQVDPKNPGIKNISYQIPSYDREGNVTGYKKSIFTKTVYDPKYYSDERIYYLGRQASNKITRSDLDSGKPYIDKEAEGVKFRIYIREGVVENFHPQVD